MRQFICVQTYGDQWGPFRVKPLTNLRLFCRCMGATPLHQHGTSYAQPHPASTRLEKLFAGGPLLCLERAVGGRAGVDDELWRSPSFRAQVYPDLPVASTVAGLLQRSLGGGSNNSSTPGAPPHSLAAAPNTSTDKWTVQTVAAQLRSEDQLRALILEAATASGGEAGAGPGADALLLVSGSHPGRGLPGAAR